METVMINEAVEAPSPGSVYGNYLVKGYSRDTGKIGYDVKFCKKTSICYQWQGF